MDKMTRMSMVLKHLLPVFVAYTLSSCTTSDVPDDSAATPQATSSRSHNINLTEQSTDGGNIEIPRGNQPPDQGFVGTPARLEVTPSSYDFQIQSINSATYASFTVKNVGQQNAIGITATGLTAPYEFRNGSYPGFRGTCGTTLEPGVSCSITIAFSPVALGRYQLNSFKVKYDQGAVTIPLDATVSNIATLRLSNIIDDFDFWNFGEISSQTLVTKKIHVTYYGARPATGVSFSGLTSPYQILSNTCGDEISSDCELTVQFGGSSIGPAQQKLKVTYNNSSYAAEANHQFSGSISQQATPAILSITPAKFGLQLVGSSTDQTILISRLGSLSATQISTSINNTAFTFKGGTFPGTGGTCTTEEISSNCTVVVTFKPLLAQAYSGDLTFTYYNGSQFTSVTAFINGIGGNRAILSMTPLTNPVDYGSWPIGTSTNRTVTITNSPTSVAATQVTIALSAGAAFTYLGGCGSTLNPGASCTATIRFKPVASGNATQNISVSFYDGVEIQAGPQRVLTGEGTSFGVLSPYVATYDFGSVMVGATKIVALTIYYYGAVSATVDSTTGIEAPFSYPTESFSGGGTCTNTIVSSCTVKIAFSPTETKSYNTQFEIHYNGGDGPKTIRISLSGRGVNYNAAILQFAQNPLVDFGSVAVGNKKSLILTINRSGDLPATSVSISGLSAPITFEGGSFPGIGGTCSTTISSTNCTMVLSFSPTIEAVTARTLTLSYNDGFQPQQVSLNLSGSGLYSAKLLATSGVFFQVPLFGTSTLTLTITNTGQRQAEGILMATSPQAPFTVLNNQCTEQLGIGRTCDVQLKFTQRQPGLFNGSIGFNYFNGIAVTQLSIPLSAAATVSPLISVNGHFSCARNTFGQLICWGLNNYGQLGQGDTGNRLSTASLQPIDFGNGHYPVAISTGFSHACAILDDSSLKCWGNNQYGQLGVGMATPMLGAQAGEMGSYLPSVNLGSSKTAVALSLGYSHSCVLLNTGDIKCWGQNHEGQLGLGDSVDRGRQHTDMGDSLPVVDLGNSKALQIAAGTSHSCALLVDHSIKCWGNNFFGQLGLGDLLNRAINPDEMGNNLLAVDLGTGRTASSISVGGAFSCAILDNGKVKCWGRNEEGILGMQYSQDADGNIGPASDTLNYPLLLRGVGTRPNQLGDHLPYIDLGSGINVISMTSGDSSSCTLLDNGAVKCWGQNQYGQLGLGNIQSYGLSESDMGNNLPEVNLGTGLTPVTISSGNFHNCALFTDSTLKCWGSNRYGNLGLGDTINRGDYSAQMGDLLGFVPY